MPLSIDAASYTYALGTEMAQPAVDSVSFDVATGELVLILGTTGSGKSTLLRMAAGLLEPRSGGASIDGEVLTSASARGRVGLVFQNPESQLFADTLVEDVMFGPRNLGLSPVDARHRAIETLAQVGLDPATFSERSPFSLSGGEARRAAFAGVLAMHPAYLLADEPTAGLDARGRAALRGLLRDVRSRAGVVVVTHTAEEFLAEADRVVLLYSGKMSWSGPAAELIRDPTPLLEAGLVPPPLLEVQRQAGARGVRVAEHTLDPQVAARALATAAGWA